MNKKLAMKGVGAIAIALALSTAYAADPNTDAKPLTGKEKATAIGAGTGAVAGAVVGGPVGAVVGAGVGAVIGHEGTDANGKVQSTNNGKTSMASPDNTVRSAQMALNDQGYNAGSPDGQFGPATASATRKFQADKGLTQTGTLDNATLAALGVAH